MLAREIPKSLIGNAQVFLNTYVLAVAGTSQTGKVLWKAAFDQGANKVRVSPRGNGPINANGCDSSKGATTFRAYSVPMTYDQVSPCDIPAGDDSCQLILTGQMTGCSYGVASGSDSGVKCFHKKPVGVSGVELEQSLEEMPELASYNIWGMSKYTGNKLTIVGVWQGNQWRFWGQEWDDTEIRRVYRLPIVAYVT